MGYKLVLVPPNWDHPQSLKFSRTYGYQPMYDRHFDDAASEWKAEYAKWCAGERPSHFNDEDYKKDHMGQPEVEFWEWYGAPPERENHRPWKDEEATWYQVWENVSEGTPVTPPFATKKELIDYLAENGDFCDQRRRKERNDHKQVWTREIAEAFVNDVKWAPSLILDRKGVRYGIEALVTPERREAHSSDRD